MANTGIITLSAVNNGPTPDPAAVIRDNTATGFGAAVTFAQPFNVTYGGGASGPATVTAAVLAAGLSVNLPVGGTAVVGMPFTTAQAAVNATNTATITTSLPGGDSNLANNTSTVTGSIVVATCCINIQNIVVVPNPVPANEPFTVTADISNCGTPALLSGYAVLTGFPAGVTLPSGNTQTWSGIPSLGFVTKQWPGLNNSAVSTTFTATITANGNCGSGPVQDVDTVPIPVGSPRQVQITTVKSGNDPSVGVGSAFVNTYTNVGPDNAAGITLRDTPGIGYGTRWRLGALGATITYINNGNGAPTGPASVTTAQLVNGFVVTNWPLNGQVQVSYSVFGVQGGGQNENCAEVVVPPGVTLSNPANAQFCLPFNVTGASNCACTATYDVTPTDITVGQSFTAVYTLPTGPNCCNTVEFRKISYPTIQDGLNNTNGVDTIQGSPIACTTLGASGSFQFTPGATGVERYYISVINNGSPQPVYCNITDSNQVFGNPPLPTVGNVALSGSWQLHNIT